MSCRVMGRRSGPSRGAIRRHNNFSDSDNSRRASAADVGAFAHQFLIVNQTFEDGALELTPARSQHQFATTERPTGRIDRDGRHGIGSPAPTGRRGLAATVRRRIHGRRSERARRFARGPRSRPAQCSMPARSGQDRLHRGLSATRSECAAGIRLIECGQHRGTLRPPPPAKRREGVKYGSPGQGLSSACMTQDEERPSRARGPARQEQFARRAALASRDSSTR